MYSFILSCDAESESGVGTQLDNEVGTQWRKPSALLWSEFVPARELHSREIRRAVRAVWKGKYCRRIESYSPYLGPYPSAKSSHQSEVAPPALSPVWRHQDQVSVAGALNAPFGIRLTEFEEVAGSKFPERPKVKDNCGSGYWRFELIISAIHINRCVVVCSQQHSTKIGDDRQVNQSSTTCGGFTGS